MSGNYWMGGVSESEAEESRSGARYDTRSLRLIAGAWVDEDRVPALSDIPEEDWR